MVTRLRHITHHLNAKDTNFKLISVNYKALKNKFNRDKKSQ